MCYADLDCFEEVLEKMAIYTSMPDRSKQAMVIIRNDYYLFYEEFRTFFSDIRLHVKNNGLDKNYE